MIIKKMIYPDASGYRESLYPDALGYRESWYPDASWLIWTNQSSRRQSCCSDWSKSRYDASGTTIHGTPTRRGTVFCWYPDASGYYDSRYPDASGYIVFLIIIGTFHWLTSLIQDIALEQKPKACLSSFPFPKWCKQLGNISVPKCKWLCNFINCILLPFHV